MKIYSPYGKDVYQELDSVYGFSSVEAFERFLREHVQKYYNLQNFEIKSIHVAFGLTIEIKTRETYF